MNKFRKWKAQKVAEEMLEVLKFKGYDAHYAEDLTEAKEKILSMIPAGSSVALGGSETLSAMDMINTIKN